MCALIRIRLERVGADASQEKPGWFNPYFVTNDVANCSRNAAPKNSGSVMTGLHGLVSFLIMICIYYLYP